MLSSCSVVLLIDRISLVRLVGRFLCRHQGAPIRVLPFWYFWEIFPLSPNQSHCVINLLRHVVQYHKGPFVRPFACPILQLNFLESFPFSRTCICLQAICIFVFWICYLWQSIGNEPEIDMINRFCRQRTKTRTFLCFKYFLSGYFEYQVHLNIYQNTKIDAYGQTIYSGINSPCNTCVVIEVEPIFSIHFEQLLSIDNTRLHQIW